MVELSLRRGLVGYTFSLGIERRERWGDWEEQIRGFF